VDRAGSVPPVSADLRTTGQIATTANNTINLGGAWVVDGLIFHCGITGSAGSPVLNIANVAERPILMRNCALRNGSTAGGAIVLGLVWVGSFIELRNTTMQWAGTANGLTISGTVHWLDTVSAITGATFPTTLISPTTTRGGSLLAQGVDLSALGTGKTIVGNGSATANSISIVFQDCKFNASVTKAATPTSAGGMFPEFIRCGSTGINYDYERYRYQGTQTIETTIVRTGGASDGVTPIAWKIITTANSRWALPFLCPPIAIWNTIDGSAVTVTVEGIWGGGAVPNNDDIWIEVEYLGDNASPQASFQKSTKADNLATGSALASSTETWGGSTTKFKMTATFTPQQPGFIYVHVRAAKASSTFYVDPKIAVS